jgi:hypothetical protein
MLKRISAAAVALLMVVACVVFPVPKAKANDAADLIESVRILGGAFSMLAVDVRRMHDEAAARDELVKADIIARQQLTEAVERLTKAMERKP